MHLCDAQVALAHLGLPCSKDYLSEMLQQYDENHDGKIEFTEFEHYVQRRQGAIEKAFDKLDADKSGSISERELVSTAAAHSNHLQACWK